MFVRISVVLALITILGLSLLQPRAALCQIVATVGDRQITAADITAKQAIAKAYGNANLSRAAALISLINTAIEGQIAKDKSVTPTVEELSNLAIHAEKTSKAPQVLSAIKGVFENDEDNYRQGFLGPKITNKKLRVFYSTSPSVHETVKAKANEALALALSGTAMESAAQTNQLSFGTATIEGSAPSQSPEKLPYGMSMPENPLLAVVRNMTPDSVYGSLIEDNRSFRIVKLLSVDGEKYTVELITAVKDRFDVWLKEQATNITIAVSDAELASTLRASYGRVWWIQNLAGD